jgi:cytochrome c oxidase cbb3-type subunit 3
MDQDDRQDKVKDHDYDGIQEFDNKLPNWWVGTFVVTALLGLYIWTSHHTFSAKPDTRAVFAADMAENKKLQESKSSGEATDAQILALKDNPVELALGKQVFMANCVACHGNLGQGIIGPNLTDRYWLHGGKPSQIAHTITHGVPEKGMPTWKPVLGDDKVRHAAAYVVSLAGTNPPNPKAAQGELEK